MHPNQTHLTVTRREGESIRIGQDITVTVTRTGAKQIRLTVSAPESVHILRSELAER